MKTENKQLLRAFRDIFFGCLLYSAAPLIAYAINPPKNIETVEIEQGSYENTARLVTYDDLRALVVRSGSTNISLVDLGPDGALDYKRITSYARQSGGAVITSKPSLEDQIVYERIKQ